MAERPDQIQQAAPGDVPVAYSERVVEHGANPRNLGEMKGADGFARITGPCGDTMEIWIKVNAETIVNATFRTDGCGTSVASGSMITELARGKKTGEALAIGERDVLAALGGLPDESEHCALLAANTLKAAIRDYRATKREPWKRAYRKGA